jgi:dynein heavy chain
MVPYADGKLSWPSPPSGISHEKVVQHISEMPAKGESPLYFGMHPNAEINFRTVQCDKLFEILMELAGDAGASGGDDGDVGQSPDDISLQTCRDILEIVREKFYAPDDISRDMSEEEKGPFEYVFLQELESMGGLLHEMRRGLEELEKGFKGLLTMSEQMEDLKNALYFQRMPFWWAADKLGFPSTRTLVSWTVNLQERFVQLDDWVGDKNVPIVTDIAKFFKPNSFLTAIKQVTCVRDLLELDKLMVYTEVTKKDDPKKMEAKSKQGVYVTGLFLEGARWDKSTGSMEDSFPKVMAEMMPIINCTANLALDKADKNSYICPTYSVPIRRPWFVFSAQLRTKAPPDKWVLAGVAMILDMSI